MARRRPATRRSDTSAALETINRAVVGCMQCPQLREYCAQVARDKRKAYADWEYWGKPVPSFGDPAARILLVGLAPGAHGANRTGRMFTGDRSGDFLYAALHRAKLASQPTSTQRGDGLELQNVYITAALHCAPPGNKPTAEQRRRCNGYLSSEIESMQPAVVLCLGGIAWDAALSALATLDYVMPRPKPKFGHGAEVALSGLTLLGCYHVSQQNTFTGRLTEQMIDVVLNRAAELAG